MSVDFGFVLVGIVDDPVGVEPDFNRRMASLGYRSAPDLVPIRFVEERGVFEEIEEGESDGQGPHKCGWAREY